ncbi:MAG: PKD domain-containing protein [Bacteroidetes bacterium]|nr:PKD domain-containing protein [Bacteroidota bacterium]
MKKVLVFLLLFFCFINLSFAQIKIGKSDMPASGDELYFSNATGKVDDSTTGANVTWDYSSLTPTNNDTIKYVSPPSLYALVFFGNIAQKATILGQKGYNFFASGSGSYSQTGTGFKIPFLNVDAPLKYSDADEVYKFPLTYGDTLKDSFYLKQAIGAGKIVFAGSRKTVVDGYGKITTPYGTFNCIRVKSTVRERDTISYTVFSIKIPVPYNNDRVEYKWLAKGQKNPILQVDVSTSFLGSTQTITYKDSARIIYNPNGPKPNFTASDSVIYTGDSINIKNNTNGFNTYVWDITPTSHTYVSGSTTATASPNIRFDKAGKYSVSLRATGFTGRNTLTKKDYIIVKDAIAPLADFKADHTYTGNQQTVFFTDLSSNVPKTWLWKFSPITVTFMDGTGDTSRNPHVRFDSVGKYSVTLYAGNKAGTSNSNKSDYITVVKGVGIEEISNYNLPLQIQPNPSLDGRFIIQIPEQGKNNSSTIIITDITGKKVFAEASINKESFELKLNQPKGVYLINVVTAKGVYVGKLVVL